MHGDPPGVERPAVAPAGGRGARVKESLETRTIKALARLRPALLRGGAPARSAIQAIQDIVVGIVGGAQEDASESLLSVLTDSLTGLCQDKRLDDAGRAAARDLLKRLTEQARMAGLGLAVRGHGLEVPGLARSDRRGGMSVVTCCMNRNANLARALPSWLALGSVSEIVVVDWSSAIPVSETLENAGVSDPRVRIVRVENAERWVLSHAFNLGFRLAQGEFIIKADADIVLDPAFLARNPLEPGHFVAGNWRLAEKGQEYVNGFFVVRRSDLADVGGFNEFITTYGWDDDDLYSRLVLSGLRRRDLDPGSVTHLDHDDAQRFGAVQGGEDAGSEIRATASHKIRTNRVISGVMPLWNGASAQTPFKALGVDDHGVLRLEMGKPIAQAAEAVTTFASYAATLEILSWRLGPKALNLAPPQLDRMLRRRRSDLSRVELEVALGARPEQVTPSGYLNCLDLRTTDEPDHPDLLAAIQGLSIVSQGRVCFLVGDEDLPQAQVSWLERFGSILKASDIGDLRPLDNPEWTLLAADKPSKNSRITVKHLLADHRQAVEIGKAELSQLPIAGPSLAVDEVDVAAENTMPPSGEGAAPTPPMSGDQPEKQRRVSTGQDRRRLMVDAVGGLGERLLSIGTAAALAKRIDRDLTIIWRPDEACGAELGALFDYDGLVLAHPPFDVDDDSSACLLVDGRSGVDGMVDVNQIAAEEGRAIIVRSAHQMVSQQAYGGESAQFLRRLAPAGAVRRLLADLPMSFELSLHLRADAAGEGARGAVARESSDSNADGGRAQRLFAAAEVDRFAAYIRTHHPALRPDQLFLASNTQAAYGLLEEALGGPVGRVMRDSDGGIESAAQAALADMYGLGRSGLLLGSFSSAFSEAAMKLSPLKVRGVYSGVDF